MNLDALTTAGTLAMVAAVLFLASARLWNILARLAVGTSAFRDSTMREAAQRFRDESEHLSRKNACYLSSVLISSIIFAIALALGFKGLYAGYPIWQLGIISLLLASFGVFVLYKLAITLSRLADRTPAAASFRDPGIGIPRREDRRQRYRPCFDRP